MTDAPLVVKQSESTVIDRIEFIVETNPSYKGFIVKTEKNPRMFVTHPDIEEAIMEAFKIYLTRLAEILHPELLAERLATQKAIDDKNAGLAPKPEHDSNGETDVK